MPSRDYEEFIAALNRHEVRYLVIGAHALAFHAIPRATKDLDILVEPDPDNAKRALKAVKDFFGGAELGYTETDLCNTTTVIQLGYAPVRIDLLAGLSKDLPFERLWKNRVHAHFGNVPTHYLGFDDLIQAKEAANRPQDRVDVRTLRRIREQIQKGPERPHPRPRRQK